MSQIQTPSPTCLRILQFTDLHLLEGQERRLAGVDTAESFRACVALARRHHWPADLVLLTGDLAHEPEPAAYVRLHALLEELQGPVYALPGNHDDGGLLRGMSHAGEPLVRHHAIRGAWQFVFLDSTVPGSDGGHLAAAELDHLQDCLTGHPQHFTLVCLHHSPVALQSAWLDSMRIDNAAALFQRLDAHPRPGGVLWGHVHQEHDSTYHGWRLLAAPSTCIQFAPGSQAFGLDPRPPGYRWLQLHDDGAIETGVRRLAALPPGFDPDAPGY